jgi:hypothetical protein
MMLSRDSRIELSGHTYSQLQVPTHLDTLEYSSAHYLGLFDSLLCIRMHHPLSLLFSHRTSLGIAANCPCDDTLIHILCNITVLMSKHGN